MKRLMRILGVFLLCGAIALPQCELSAQGRRPGAEHGNHQSGRHQDKNGDRGSHNSNADRGNHNRRPDHGNQRPDRPNQNRPNGGNHNQGSNHGNNRPNQNTPRPNQGNHFGSGNRPAPPQQYRPTPPPQHRPAPPRPPHRPHRPNVFWNSRPAPPPAFRPHYHLNPLQAILGIAVGTAFNASLNYLYANNYNVDGYADNQLFLRNVNAFNTVWPDAVLTYTNGYLTNSSFSYSTPYYDSGCYNRVFRLLTNNYGSPVSTTRQNNGWSATWWGYDNRYLTLDFRPYYAVDGSLRYYTTLTVG